MCGISGIINYGSSNGLALDKDLNIMKQSLSHRGPDDSGIWSNEDKNVGLVHTRLSILDLSKAGHQPMLDNEANNVITYNGEVFNYMDINQTEFYDEKFTTKTDTETILNLYKKYKFKMFNKMNGMFAFAIWDEKELILARDQSGKKPLYYTEQNGQFIFASELKAILALPSIKRELDEKALYDFLTYNLVLPPQTMFKGIYKFEPGHVMRVNHDGIIDYKPYYCLQKKDCNYKNEDQLADKVYETLAKSVKYRMISDVPVGAFLSGGVDSSAIVALMRQNTEKQIKTFTIGFKGQPNYNEIEHSEKVAKMFNTEHFVKIVKQEDLLESLDTIVDIYDEPQADTTSIPIHFLSKLANEQNIKVVLNGDGPDELFAGYNNYMRNLNYHPYFKAFSKLPYHLKTKLGGILQNFNNGNPAFDILNRGINNQEFYWPGATSIKESEKHNILTENFRNRIGEHSSYWYIEKLKKQYFKFNSNIKDTSDLIEWMSYTGYLHADIQNFLFRADRLGMANSIETRSPFLNIEMVELAMSIPSKYKIKNKIPKYILKKSLERILPKEVLYRKKMGFCVPIKEWASDTIVNYVDNNLQNFTSNYDIFEKSILQKQINQIKAGNSNYTNNIWTTYFLMKWIEKWL